MKKLNYGFQTIDDGDVELVAKALKDDWLTTGPAIDKFEKVFAKRVGSKYAVAVCNGTAALHIAVLSLDLPEGSEGITTPLSFVATSNAMLYCGLKPVFVDIDKSTYNIDPNLIKDKLSKNIKLLMPVHFAGRPCDMKKIKDLSGKRFIIEDAAHALGSKYENGKMVGSCCYSDMTIFSFHPVKTITTGEGGMVTTNSKILYEKLKLLRTHGITKKFSKDFISPGPWYYEMVDLGFNYRLTDFQAVLGLSQLKKLNKFIIKRRKIVEIYNNSFKNIDWIKTPNDINNDFITYHLYVIQINFEKIGKTRGEVMKILSDCGINTQVHYIPIYLQPYYRKKFGYKDGYCVNVENYYKNCLSLPLFPLMNQKDVLRVVKSIKNLYHF